MKLRYYPDTDFLYIDLSSKPSVDSREISEGIVLDIDIKRHIKIKAEANPYLPEFSEYFWRRRNVKEAHLLGALSHHQYKAMIATR